ncbi:MAG: hypothetical protein K6V97_09100 [Actinomycetia bacterium]|nr:hypothetical protein [Actinomycetes bacterium]
MITTTGRVVHTHQIETVAELPVGQVVRLVVWLTEDAADDVSEEDWRRMAALSAAYDFLAGSEEDVYTLEDGLPIELAEEAAENDRGRLSGS